MLLLEDTSYQTLVTVMDKVRSYPTVAQLEVVQAELFPVISLGDAPVPAGVEANKVANTSAASAGARS